MTDETKLARRAVACDGWRWMPGMQTLWLPTPYLPDLTDPATLGCVLALVREAWGMPRLVAIPQPDGEWTVSGLTSVASGDTEAAALVAALEAAPVGGAR